MQHSSKNIVLQSDCESLRISNEYQPNLKFDILDKKIGLFKKKSKKAKDLEAKRLEKKDFL